MTQWAKQAVEIIQQRIPKFTANLGIILGSGLGLLASKIESVAKIDYQDLPGFPVSTVAGHAGYLHLGKLNGLSVACLQGRAHFYEGITNEHVQTPMRLLRLLGCDTLLATNSAGSLRPEVSPGNLVIIRDHINFQFNNPLVGPNDEKFGPRFIGMEDTYDQSLRSKLLTAGKKLNIPLTEGVYIGVLGPTFETPAEINAYRLLGGEVIGMSTIPEVIAARHCGLRVAAISIITNMGAGMHPGKLTHEVTLKGAELAVDKLIKLVLGFIEEYRS